MTHSHNSRLVPRFRTEYAISHLLKRLGSDLVYFIAHLADWDLTIVHEKLVKKSQYPYTYRLREMAYLTPKIFDFDRPALKSHDQTGFQLVLGSIQL